jgi:multisubunit Na+/H+ antiporter MnhE subunit
MRWVLVGACLAGAFLLMIGSVEAADWVIAAVLGAAATLAARAALPRRDEPAAIERMRLAGAPRFAAGAAAELVAGTLKTLQALLRAGPERGGQLVEISVANRSDAAIAVDGLVISAVPGTVVIVTDNARQRMLIHTIEVADPEQIRRDLDRFYERYQRSLLP